MKYKYVSNPKLRDMLENSRKTRGLEFRQDQIAPLKIDANSIQKDPNKKPEPKVEIKRKEVTQAHRQKVNVLQSYLAASERERKTDFAYSLEDKTAKRDAQKKKAQAQNIRLKTPPTKELAVATKQLASMVRTGLPLLEALKIISDTNENPTLKYVFLETAIGISQGNTMVDNLVKYPSVFNDMYVALVSAGETAGLLPETLERQAGLLESLSKIKGQIKSAMAYPIAIFAITFIVVILMMLFVIPIFVDIYSQSGTKLPAITAMLVSASNQLQSIGFYMKAVPMGLALLFLFRYLSAKPSVLFWFDSILLKLPITKDLVTKSCLANFSRTLSALNSAGVPILESLVIAKRTLGNRVFMRIIDKMYADIQAGSPIYRVLENEMIIPVMFTSMFRIGEETGELSQMVTKLADFYEDEVQASVKSLTSILEPLMIVFVAVVVAVILIAMYLPMFSMMSTVG